jgi:hypothetical protein
MSETFLDERKFLSPPPPPPPPIHILMQGMQESKQTMTYKICKNPKRKTLQKNKTPQKKPLQKSQQAQQAQLSISPMSKT